MPAVAGGGAGVAYEKFVLDADQLGVLHSLAEGIDLSENGQAMGRSGGRAGRALPRLPAYPGQLQEGVLADAGLGLPAVRDLVGGREPGIGRARQCPGARGCSAEYEAPAIDPGAAEALQAFVDAAQGVEAGRLRVAAARRGNRAFRRARLASPRGCRWRRGTGGPRPRDRGPWKHRSSTRPSSCSSRW